MFINKNTIRLACLKTDKTLCCFLIFCKHFEPGSQDFHSDCVFQSFAMSQEKWPHWSSVTFHGHCNFLTLLAEHNLVR